MKHLILISTLLLLTLCGCEETNPGKEVLATPYGESVKYKTGCLWVDTVNIHGNPHEIILRRTAYNDHAVGGMMHSPECWCLNKAE